MASSWLDSNSDRTVIRRAPLDPTLRAGTTLINGTYLIEAFLARGGMGEVYRARHVDHGTQHAIKVILPELAKDEKVVQLFIREARELGRIESDTIVDYQGFLRDEKGARCLIMEFVDGEPLGTVLQRRRFEPPEVLALLRRLGQGLVAAHDLGIVHRDISPENIILPGGEIEHAKLVDFGIAKSNDPSDRTLIGGDFAGKFSFVSPEQAGLYGGVVDHRSDIYSLGLVLAAAALGFGRKLDMGASPASVIEARQSVPDLNALPPGLKPLLAHMLQPRPQDRPASMQAVLDEASGKKPLPTVSTTAKAGQKPPPRIGRLMLWLGGGTALAAGIVGGTVLLLNGRLADPPIDEVRRQLVITASAYRCADLTYSADADRVVSFRGYVANDQDLTRLQAALAGLRGVAKLDFDVRQRAWPYCQAYSLLKPLAAPGGRTASIRFDPPGADAYAGRPLALELQAPAFDSYVYVDYFRASGEVVHLFPNDRDWFNYRPARNRFALGQPMQHCWTLAGEPGEQMITLIASARRLFGDAPLPAVESAKEYLPRLQEALSRDAGSRRSAAMMFYDLRPGETPKAGDSGCPAG